MIKTTFNFCFVIPSFITLNHRERRMWSSFKMSLFGIFILFFLGSSNAFSRLDYVDSAGWLHYVTDNGVNFTVMPGDDLVVYVKDAGVGQKWIDYCKVVNNVTKECEQSLNEYDGGLGTFVHIYLDHLKYVGTAKLIVGNEYILKYDVVVMEPTQHSVYPMDVTVFYSPAFSFYINNEDFLKVLFHVDRVDTLGLGIPEFHAYFVDREDKCRDYRPKVVNGTNFLNLNVFANPQWAKYAYYFIKKDNFVCAYTFVFNDWLNIHFDEIHESKPINFSLIDNYPTQHYAPNFFCIDALYGTFVSLYWNQQKSNNLPEAHYYIINEKDIKKIQLIDRIVLKNFDADVLKDIFENNFDTVHFPTFTSYGRQIFIWFKRPSDTRAFNGFWKNETEYEVHFQDYSYNDFRKIFRAKKEWIQFDRPIGRYDAPSLPPPIEIPQQQGEGNSGTATSLPSTISLSTDAPSVNTSNSNSSNNDTDSVQSPPKPAPLTAQSDSGSNKDCSFLEDNLWWLFIMLIVIDILEVIILVILIFLKFRGAKKMKAAMAKKKGFKSVKIKAPKSATETKETAPKKNATKKKEKKKSIKEKSITQITEGTGKPAKIDAKKNTTTVDQTNYFTVNETFDHSVQKNATK